MALNPKGTFGETLPLPSTPLIPYSPAMGVEYLRAIGGQLPVGYYNSGFSAGAILRGIGRVAAYAGGVAAEVLPAIYLQKQAAHPAAAAAGPTGVPAMTPPSAISRAVQAAEHPILTTEQLLGMSGSTTTHHGRYGTPGEKGYHLIKKGPHAGLWTKNRHRNVANIHALRRSLSRIHGFEKICRKVVHFVHPRRAVGHAVFKKRRRS